jgi:D-alanyl-lipoteichoic acid acyltransferase DltB (MBOAT superfamily)
MLFSSPDYPVFLIAVFFLYGLARWGGGAFEWARVALMVLLVDVVYLLVAKDTAALWDPLGGVLLRLASDEPIPWTDELGPWVCGLLVLGCAIAIGRRFGAWIASPEGQRHIGVGFVAVIGAVGATVLATRLHGVATLDAATMILVLHSHLVVLCLIGIAIGASGTNAAPALGRVVVLFIASSLFYHAWAAAMPGAYRYLLFLLLATIVLDYYLGIWIENATEPGLRKLLVVVSLCSNLGILVVFKYSDFVIHDVLLLDVPYLDLILPAGISFHTFQSLSYTIDVYRRELPATRSVIEFATFVLFFPQLVAGPIVRAQDLLPQLGAPPPLELARATDGLYRIVVGLFKKIAIADTLALSIVDRVFAAPEQFSSIEVLFAVYGYALQIFCDFSAYSDIAIGSAQVLGFTMPENFRTPYRSATLQEFWRRWHISLSTWLRDYLYVSLGGNRRGEAMTYLNLAATMLLGGLWHGASWAFIVWGALHGFGLAVTRYFQRAPARLHGQLWMACGAIAGAGLVLAIGVRIAGGLGVWPMLIALWLGLTPTWAFATVWAGEVRTRPAVVPRWSDPRLVEGLRFAMCAAALVFLAGLAVAESWAWIPLALVPWALGLAADVLEHAGEDWLDRLVDVLRRSLGVVLVFHYVCLAWIFFRAGSFANALAILERLGEGSFDHANLVAIVTTSLVVGFTWHFFADGGSAWLRRRFVALPPVAQGILLAGVALVLRQLAHHEIVPFIYFQF